MVLQVWFVSALKPTIWRRWRKYYLILYLWSMWTQYYILPWGWKSLAAPLVADLFEIQTCVYTQYKVHIELWSKLCVNPDTHFSSAGVCNSLCFCWMNFHRISFFSFLGLGGRSSNCFSIFTLTESVSQLGKQQCSCEERNAKQGGTTCQTESERGKNKKEFCKTTLK